MGDEGEEDEEEEKGPSLLKQILTFLLFTFLFVPVVVIALAFLFGAILAAAEGWHIIDGFYYVISMLCGLPNPLTDVNPDTDLGKFVDIVIALWSLAVAGCVIGIVGGMSIVTNFTEAAESASFFHRSKVTATLQREISTTAGGSVDFDQFRQIIKKMTDGKKVPSETHLREIFHAIDTDGTNLIDSQEAGEFAKRMSSGGESIEVFLLKAKVLNLESKMDKMLAGMDKILQSK